MSARKIKTLVLAPAPNLTPPTINYATYSVIHHKLTANGCVLIDYILEPPIDPTADPILIGSMPVDYSNDVIIYILWRDKVWRVFDKPLTNLFEELNQLKDKNPASFKKSFNDAKHNPGV